MAEKLITHSERGITDQLPVSCSIAENEADKWARLQILTQRYLEVGYIGHNDSRIINGVYVDDYEESSIPIVAKIGDKTVGSLRLVKDKDDLPMPIKSEGEVKIYEGKQALVDRVDFEWSQLAKAKDFSRDSRPVYALIRAGIAISRELGIEDGVAVIDDKVRKYLNGVRISLNLGDIGPTVDYMGSLSTPVYLNFESMVQSCARAGNSNLSEFLDTGQAPGFEWYKGP